MNENEQIGNLVKYLSENGQLLIGDGFGADSVPDTVPVKFDGKHLVIKRADTLLHALEAIVQTLAWLD